MIERAGTRRASGINGRDRRRFLTLAASGLVGGLVLRLDREARGAVESPSRFVLYNNANGLQKMHLDRSSVRSASDFSLASFMTHFEPHKAELTVVQNLYCSVGEYLHGNASSALSCVDRGPSDGANGTSQIVVGGPTIDQLIASQIGQQERLRSLVLGHPFNVDDWNCTQGTIVGRAKNEPVYPSLDPVKAHELVFGLTGQGMPQYLNTIRAVLPSAELQKFTASDRSAEFSTNAGLRRFDFNATQTVMENAEAEAATVKELAQRLPCLAGVPDSVCVRELLKTVGSELYQEPIAEPLVAKLVAYSSRTQRQMLMKRWPS